MDRFYCIILFLYVSFIIFVCIHFVEANDVQVHRQKRYLAFQNISHFFIRFNFKANIVPWNQLFAQAIGYRVNWNDPPDSFHPHHHVTRRTLYGNMEMLLDRNGLAGSHCVRRALCESRHIEEPKQIYFKLLKIIFRQSLETASLHNTTQEDCLMSTQVCPFSLYDVSTYTDI